MAFSEFKRRRIGARYQWIVFDAVGTLIHPEPAVAEAYHSIATRYGSRLERADVAERFRSAFRQSEAMSFCGVATTNSHCLSSDAIEAARWRWIVGQVVPDVTDREQCFDDLWRHFASPASWACFDEVERNLTALRENGYRLAIASNFDSRLHSVCEGHPCLNLIEHRFVSSETGYRKPAQEFYAAVISRLNCPADQILMIGDDPEHDVVGPQVAGMGSLLLDRRLHKDSADAIKSLNDLMLNQLL